VIVTGCLGPSGLYPRTSPPHSGRHGRTNTKQVLDAVHMVRGRPVARSRFIDAAAAQATQPDAAPLQSYLKISEGCKPQVQVLGSSPTAGAALQFTACARESCASRKSWWAEP